MHLNIEFKARCSDPDRIRMILKELKADCIGTDHQVDTYFKCPNGRLKLREGTIEHSLIFYDRDNQPGPKKARIHLYRPEPDPALKELLTAALGIKVVVEKTREIYFIDTVKFHIDTVSSLGSFIEVEAIDADGTIGEDTLREHCDYYQTLLNVKPHDLVSCSYSDMMFET